MSKLLSVTLVFQDESPDLAHPLARQRRVVVTPEFVPRLSDETLEVQLRILLTLANEFGLTSEYQERLRAIHAAAERVQKRIGA